MIDYRIVGDDLQAVICELGAGDAVVAEAGHLLALTDSLALQTKSGGLLGGLKRAIGGSSFFLNEITAKASGRAVFASPAPGKVQELEINAQRGWLCQPHVFLCSDKTVEQSAAFTKRFGAGLFGGTGFILQALNGQGKAFIHVGGTCLKYQLAANETLRVETGSLAAFESSVTYSVQMVSGLKSILFSGEGLWFAHLQGPGTVYVQSLAPARLAHALAPYLPQTAGTAAMTTGGGLVGGVLSAFLNKE